MEMTDQLQDTARQLEERVRPQLEEARQRLSETNDRVVTYIKANPGACLLGAAAAGYIIGRIARR